MDAESLGNHNDDMFFAIGIPFLLGALGILQGAINRVISQETGYNIQILVTCIVALLLSFTLYFMAKLVPNSVPDFYQITSGFKFKWYYVFPGIFGFFIISTIPVAIEKFGALKVTVGIVAAQMITSVLWDLYIEKLNLTPLKIVGIILGGLSTLCIVWERK